MKSGPWQKSEGQKAVSLPLPSEPKKSLRGRADFFVSGVQAATALHAARPNAPAA
ncbi:hypothetical protein [Comamonas terrigena]|uniref:hypothetical protein n=1 Tax=Comamonas terrigena TaxID=32013 RepID=UPI002897DAEC|nr:hypothetical protein [Comamonas terrigena]